MGKRVSIAIVSERMTEHQDVIPNIIFALQDGGFLIHEVKEWEKTKQGKYLTWLQIEKGEMKWCNVCGEQTITHRTRCERCGAKRGSY